MRLTEERVRAMAKAATPGPWRTGGDGFSDVVVDSGGEGVGTVTQYRGARLGNAALIAAAPDLAADLLDAHAALATERERREDAEAAMASLHGAASDAHRTRADAAEAEVARLRGAREVVLPLQRDHLREQRDTARAEVAALRAQVDVLIAERDDARMMARCCEENWHAARAEGDAARRALSAIAEGVNVPCLADRVGAQECTAEEPCVACLAGDRVAFDRGGAS